MSSVFSKLEMRSGCKDVVTVTVQLASWLPSFVVTVIVASPVATPVTTPSLTVATDSLSELHVTFLLVAFAGATVAVRVIRLPCLTDADVLSRVTPVALTGSVTVTSAIVEVAEPCEFVATQ